MNTRVSIEQLAGQRLMVGFEGTELNDDLKFLIAQRHIGGIILFSRNLESPKQIKRLCRSVQEFALACGLPPLFIAVDQEGGDVARLKEPFTQFPGNPAMKGTDDAIYFADISSKELIGIGVNMNMAPVLDIAPEKGDSIMSARVFGNHPDRVVKLGVTVIENIQKNGIMAIAKHFPGIGRTSIDSHIDLPVFEEDIHSLQAFDLIPFAAAIKKKVSGMMLSHILYNKIDPDWPASFSRKIAKELLRRQMGFDGVVITDDLDMGAVAKHYDLKTVIQQILLSDIDIVLICHKGPKIDFAFEEIVRHLKDQPALKSEGINSFNRIIDLKKRFLSSAY